MSPPVVLHQEQLPAAVKDEPIDFEDGPETLRTAGHIEMIGLVAMHTVRLAEAQAA